MHDHIWSVTQQTCDASADTLFVRCSRCGASLSLELTPEMAACRGYYTEDVSRASFATGGGEGAL